MKPHQVLLLFLTPLAVLTGDLLGGNGAPLSPVGAESALAGSAVSVCHSAHREVRAARTIDSQAALASQRATDLPIERWQCGPTGIVQPVTARFGAPVAGRAASISIRLDGHFLVVEHVRLQI